MGGVVGGEWVGWECEGSGWGGSVRGRGGVGV